jgi:endonuclease-3
VTSRAAKNTKATSKPKAKAKAQPKAPKPKINAETETPLGLTRRARKINRILAETYPDAHCELDFTNPFQLLVATILSAQTTDVRVNMVTPELFAKYPTASDLAVANPEDVE